MTVRNWRPYLPPAVDTSSLEFIQGRIRAAAIARAGGYFWLPCPLCGVDFGGHEWDVRGDKVSHIPDERCPPAGPQGPFSYKGICPFCTEAGRGWNWYVKEVGER